MKFLVDNEVVFELSDQQLKVLESAISSDVLREDLKRRVKWVIEHKLENVSKELIESWKPKLESENTSLPVSKESLLEMVLTNPEYKDAKTKTEDEAVKLEALKGEKI